MRPSPRYLDEVRGIVMRHLASQPVDVFLFGSWARGDAQRTSDIDVALLPRGSLPPKLVAELREALEESHVPYPVDVVDLSETSGSLRARVLREGVRWSA